VLQRLGDAERAKLAPLRAQSWRGELTVAQFEERNRRYYAHPFGRTRMQTWGWIECGKIVSSLDAVSVPMLQHESGRAHQVAGWHLASIVTPPEFRRQGWAGRLVEVFLQQNPAPCTLASGIGTAFYEKLGFRAAQAWHCEALANSEGHEAPSEKLEVGGFVGELREHRRRQVLRQPGSLALLPDALWWDWLAGIYQYYASTRDRRVPAGRFLRTELESGPVWLAALEHVPNRTLEVWWASDINPLLVQHLARWAAKLGMDKVAWMAGEKSSHALREVYPMHCSGAAQLIDAQFGDCW